MPSLRETIDRTYVIAYQEDVGPLVEALASEELNPTVLRASYSGEEMTYARATRCLLSHHRAWQRAAEQDGWTLVCEADFVPCVGIGGFPTFWPIEEPRSWGYLYQGSPRILGLVGARPYLRGHCAPLVSYVVSREVARVLCYFFKEEMAKYDPTEYFPFDAHLQWRLMWYECSAYIPHHHYGEHGGLPNPEHREYGIPRAGTHRADNLAARLHFLPQYCRGSWLRYMAIRAHARLLGFARLAANRWIIEVKEYPVDLRARLRMMAIGLRRLVW